MKLEVKLSNEEVKEIIKRALTERFTNTVDVADIKFEVSNVTVGYMEQETRAGFTGATCTVNV